MLDILKRKNKMITQELIEKLTHLYKELEEVSSNIFDLQWKREEIHNKIRRIEHLLKK